MERSTKTPPVVASLRAPSPDAFARELAGELAALERRIPLGSLDADEAADVTRWRDTARFAGELFAAGSSFVSSGDRLVLPPVGRNVAVIAAHDLDELCASLAPHVAALGIAGPPELEQRLASLLPGARRSPLSRMQRPAFDGPVDRRSRPITGRRRT
jgi:hypothetical protein